MARYSRRFYTNLIEHFLRMGVRYESVQGDAPKQWHEFTTNWIDKLYEDDRNLIEFIFSRMSPTTNYGLSNFPSSESFEEKQTRLYKLEQKFAIDAELISEPPVAYLPNQQGGFTHDK